MFQNVQPGQESLIGQSKISNGISTSLILPLTSLCDLFFRTVTLLTLTHETLEEILTTPQPRIPTPPPPPEELKCPGVVNTCRLLHLLSRGYPPPVLLLLPCNGSAGQQRLQNQNMPLRDVDDFKLVTFLNKILFIYFERGEGREKERERTNHVKEKPRSVASHMCPYQKGTGNLGMSPGQESN